MINHFNSDKDKCIKVENTRNIWVTYFVLYLTSILSTSQMLTFPTIYILSTFIYVPLVYVALTQYDHPQQT
jgi:hypothetical protein